MSAPIFITEWVILVIRACSFGVEVDGDAQEPFQKVDDHSWVALGLNQEVELYFLN